MVHLFRLPSFGLNLTLRPNFIWLLAIVFQLFPLNSFAQNCSIDKIDQSGVVKHVYDGDTLQLSNGEKIRLVGINTPEMHYDTGKPEPLALDAKQYLAQKTLNQRVNLRFAKDKKDKYGRKLAHVFLTDGTNLQAELLLQGLAINIAIPPNLWQHNCYFTLEKQAKVRHIGLWRNNRFKPLAAKDVNQTTLGFYLVKGTIQKFKETRRSVWLNLTDKMALRISKEEKQYFPNLSEKFWLGKTVIAKGWISEKDSRFSMRVKHQSAIEIQ